MFLGQNYNFFAEFENIFHGNFVNSKKCTNFAPAKPMMAG
jgi:hypothetical protein